VSTSKKLGAAPRGRGAHGLSTFQNVPRKLQIGLDVK